MNYTPDQLKKLRVSVNAAIAQNLPPEMMPTFCNEIDCVIDDCLVLHDQVLALCAVFQTIRKDEWEYMIRKFNAGSDRQWALSQALESVLNEFERLLK